MTLVRRFATLQLEVPMRVLLSLLFLLPAAPAHAWVAALAPSGCTDRWYTPSVDAVNITVATDSAGIDGIAAAEVHTALLSALKTWNDVQCDLCAHPGGVGCAPTACAHNPLGVTLQDGGISVHTQWGLPCAEVEPDATFNCKAIKPNGNYVVQVTDKSRWLWSQFTAAQTVVTANQATGEIVDTDILFNLAPRDDGSTFHFCASDCAAKPSAYPLCIPLTHELGHVLGLNHSANVKATMAGSAVPSDAYKCQLSADDILGVCTDYRTTCSGVAGEITLTTAQCDAKAKANAVDDTTHVPASSCHASSRPASRWNLLWLGAIASLVRLGWGRSRAKRT